MKTILSALQWVFFIIASSIVVPIAISQLYQLNAQETASLLQSTLLVLGIAGLIQVLAGHKLPINEGPAGLWWGVYSIYAGLSSTLFASNIETLQALQGAIMISGLFFIAFAAFGLIGKLAKLFTPAVTGIYLLLLVFQIGGSIIKGIFGIGYRQQTVDPVILILSVVIVLFTYYLSSHRVKAIKQYSILIGLVAGWILFAVFGAAKPVETAGNIFSLPGIFPLGFPKFDAGLLVTAFFISILLVANMLASIRVAEEAVKVTNPYTLGKDTLIQRGRRAGFGAGASHLLSGLFGAIGPVPISGAGGFIAATGSGERKPFIVGNAIIILMSFIPLILHLFAALPAPVGFAVQFVVFAGMAGMALSQFDQEKDQKRLRFIAGIALLAGIGAMYVPAQAFKGFPPVLISVLNNGLILGTLIAIAVEQLMLRVTKRSLG
ncbi:purine/pyrimidine permease [Metabacillus sp. GX 13764]|uniref:purine/pyrimidine permease n=1 Tax=Metabacillus kandeliae TaxID=2900151 RepID=UPI001E51B5B2|nr:purine/pyrimidine permease [Metabacillus kandeliae]MCD7034739.1 purine/pyrimidine permease [Metabacillus kandeliae]